MKKVIVVMLALWSFVLCVSATVGLTELRVSGMRSPLGIDTPPVFSWQTVSEERGFRQQAYEIVVCDANGATVWDSGKVESAEQNGIVYAGKPLASCADYSWTVRVWGERHGDCASAESTFETAFMNPDEWTGKWISTPLRTNAEFEIVMEQPLSARYLRIDATRLGLPAAADSKNYYMQFAEIEVYGKDGKLSYKAAASNNWNWKQKWNLDYLCDGKILGDVSLGYTTQAFSVPDSHVWLTLDLGAQREVNRVVLYPRQDDASRQDRGTVANFPENFTLQQSADNRHYSVVKTFVGERPAFTGDATNVPYFGREFTVSRPVRRARIYASGLGVFTMRLNGERVTDAVLEPGESEYERTVLYSTYDVTRLVRQGTNSVLAQVAGGLYNVELLAGRFSKGEVVNRGTTGLLAELLLEYEDGSRERIVTDGSWLTTESATTGSNWWGGEDYDARRAGAILADTALAKGEWEAAQVFTPHFASTQAEGFGILRARMYEPLRVVEEWQAVDVTAYSAGEKKWYVVDFGRNYAGQYRFRLKGKSGQVITLRSGESLNPDGTIFMEEYYTGPADTYDIYTFRGDAEGEQWGPEFMYHGFRYLLIEGLDVCPAASDFTAMRIRSDVDNGGVFVTSNQLLNDIHVICRDAIASQLYNSLTDCPHREKLGWLEVANEMFNSIVYNFDMRNFFRKVVLDCFDSQYPDGHVPSTAPHYMSVYDNDPNWGGTAILLPYGCWKVYGDKSLIREHYPQMKLLADYYTRQTEDGIMRNDLSVLSDWGQESAGVFPLVRPDFTMTITYYNLMRVMAEVAAELGNEADATGFADRAASTKDAFNKRFMSNVTPGVYGNGQQSELAMPLYYGLAEEKDETRLAELLAERVRQDGYKIKTGEIALKPLFMTLARFGYNDIIYAMANQTDCPSYGFWVKEGYTTTPEYWDVGRFSQNHCMMDHIEEWFFSVLGGIKTADDGGKHIRVAPWMPADMTSLTAATVTPYGKVGLSYDRHGDAVDYTVEIPANTVATIELPLTDDKRIVESGKKIRAGRRGVESVTIGESAVIMVGSGIYRFTVGKP